MADEVLALVQEQVGGEPCPPGEILDALHQAMDDAKRDQMIGDGVHVGTVHSAKGLEFDHVMVSGNDWSFDFNMRSRTLGQSHPHRARMEAERRLYYVAMTRASRTLTLITTPQRPLPFETELIGPNDPNNSPGLVRLRAGVATGPARADYRLRRRYRLLNLKDMHIDYAGYKPARHPIHKALSTLHTGSDQVRLQVRRGRLQVVETRGGLTIAQLSEAASSDWRDQLNSIEEARILGIVQRRVEDSSPEYRSRLKTGTWEVPIMEIRQRLQTP